MLSIRSFVVNVRDLSRASEFWSAALGYEITDVADDWVTLTPPSGVPRLCLQLTDQPPAEVPHDHLDLDAGDAAGVAAEIERLLALGAERVDWPLYESEDDGFVVLADPDGNRFCLVRTVGD